MIAAILQARMGSSRLPGKVLAQVLGEPMIARQLERIRRAKHVSRVIVATSDDERDRAICEAASRVGVPCFRGAREDVLDRFYKAALDSDAEHLVRLTADCPLADPEVIDAVIERHLAQRCDYTSNVVELTFPDGLDVEVVGFAALERAWREAREPFEREHVTPYLYRHPELFRIGSVRHERDLSRLRLTVDHPEDLEVVRAIFAELYPQKPEFTLADVVSSLERRPDLLWTNAMHNARARLDRFPGVAAPSTEPFL